MLNKAKYAAAHDCPQDSGVLQQARLCDLSLQYCINFCVEIAAQHATLGEMHTLSPCYTLISNVCHS